MAGDLETATILGRRVAYWRSGTPTPNVLVLLHGLGSDHTGLLDLAAGLPGWRVVAPDLPGFGRSEPLAGTHTLRGYAAVLDGLRRRLGLERFALLGHSFGADVALAYASTYRAVVPSLCLLNPVLRADGPEARLGQLHYDVSARLPGPAARLLLTSPAVVYLSDRVLFASRDRATRTRILHRDYVTARLADPRAVREGYLSIRRTPFDRYVRRIRARTLLVTGTRDLLVTPRSLTGLPWRAPYPRLVVVRGAGHLLPVEEPELVATLVQKFLTDRTGVRRLRTLAA
jgi:pimeloyl-ACP methyl ester carboxylesterase